MKKSLISLTGFTMIYWQFGNSAFHPLGSVNEE